MSFISTSTEGIGPARQDRMLSDSLKRTFRSSFSSLWQVRQWSGQRLILPPPDVQLTSGLCFRSQVRPKIISCFLRPVTAKVARSEWSRYRKTVSRTSEMLPDSFGEPSTLYTGMGRLNFFVAK